MHMLSYWSSNTHAKISTLRLHIQKTYWAILIFHIKLNILFTLTKGGRRPEKLLGMQRERERERERERGGGGGGRRHLQRLYDAKETGADHWLSCPILIKNCTKYLYLMQFWSFFKILKFRRSNALSGKSSFVFTWSIKCRNCLSLSF